MRVIAAAAVFLCGCGGGDGSDDPSPTPSTTPTSGSTIRPTPTASPIGFLRAWAVGSVAALDADRSGVIVRTRDAGATWATVATSSVDLLAVAFVDSLHGLATGRGEILSTNDGGDSWTLVRQVSGETLADVAFLGANRAAAVGSGPLESPGDLSGPLEILTSDDGGRTWDAVSLPASLSGRHITLSFVCFNADETGATFGQGPNGSVILRTRDGGQSWTDVSDRVASDGLIGGACVGDASFALVGNGLRLVASSDAGDSWEDHSSLLAPLFPASGELHALTFVSRNVGWAVGAKYQVLTGGDTRGVPAIARTSDGGQSWQEATVPFDATNDQRNGVLLSTASYGESGLAVGQDDATGVINPDRLSPLALLTQDAGARWTLVTLPDDVGFLTDVAVQP